MRHEEKYKKTLSDDGSFTLYSKKYEEHYHNPKDGALRESLIKHVTPAFEHAKKLFLRKVTILDICFGLGYNTLATLLAYKDSEVVLDIYAPELDLELIKSLTEFEYPAEFESLKSLICKLSRNLFYKDEKIEIKIHNGDAAQFIKSFEDEFFDVVYQDPFSAKNNSELWSEEYFDEIFRITKLGGLLTTYTRSKIITERLQKCGFALQELRNIGARNSLLAYKISQD